MFKCVQCNKDTTPQGKLLQSLWCHESKSKAIGMYNH